MVLENDCAGGIPSGVQVYLANASGINPGAWLVRLNKQSHGGGATTLAPASEYVPDGDWTYFIYVYVPSDVNPGCNITGVVSDGQTGAAGWTIGDAARVYDGSSWGAAADGRSFKFTVSVQ